jgi:predicted AAA+ superfamily ATPase
MSLSELRNAGKLYAWLRERTSRLKGRCYLFLDEIQEVEGWEDCVNSIRVEVDADIYVTGSNSRMLAGEFASLLSGRYVTLTLYPFSFAEHSAARRASGMAAGTDANALFSDYLRIGGMPFVSSHALTEAENLQYLSDVFTTVIIKDIVQRNKFRNVDLLERIITYAIANIGGTFSANSIANYFASEKRRVAPDTVLNYLRACQEAFLLYKAERYDVPSKRMLKIDEKYYIADQGLREAVFGGNERDIERLLENIVCMELLRRGYKVMCGRVGTREIDFIATQANKRIYVQVSYLLASMETVGREFGVYAEVLDNFPKYVVSLDEIDRSQDGIIHMNIRDFLQSTDY